MPRPKLNNKRFHFHGPAYLHSRAEALVQRRGARGASASISDVLREALKIGLTALEAGAHHAHVPPSATLANFDEDDLNSAVATIEALVQLGDVLPSLDTDVISALAGIDAEVFEALSSLDPEIIDKLSGLDPDSLAQLEYIDLDIIKMLEELISDATDDR